VTAPRLEVMTQLDPTRAAALEHLVATVTATTGQEALAEQKRLELAHPRPGVPVAIVATDGGGEPVAYAHLAPDARGSWHLAVVERSAGWRADLVAASVDQVAQRGGGTLRYWIPAVDAERHDEALRGGFVTERDLLQLRRPLPVEDSLRGAVPSLGLRAFRPGIDEEAWLAANNEAFAGHPEQGDWDLATLLAREAESWFDPDGFLLHFEDGELAGACWTKVHRRSDPPLGEIYVIFVHPRHQRAALGRALVLGGLDHLSAEGLRQGMLYVDGGNRRARHLYDQLGFALHHVDRAYVRWVPGAEGPHLDAP
jgi:mycothiol synthase